MRESSNRSRRPTCRPMPSTCPLHDAVELSLATAGIGIRTLGNARWSARLSHRGQRAAVRLVGDWLVVESDASRAINQIGEKLGARGLVSAHAALPKSVKLLVPETTDGPTRRHRSRLLARIEIPVASSTDDDPALEYIAARAIHACRDLLRVRSLRTADLRSTNRSGPACPNGSEDPAPADEPANPPAAGPDPLELAAAAGWSAARTGNGAVRVTLANTTGGFRQAFLSLGPAGLNAGLDLSTDLPEPVPEAHREAVDRLLLRTARNVRLIRPFHRNAGSEFGFETWLPDPGRPKDLDLALASLSVAASTSASEIEALATDVDLASAYVRRSASRGSGRLDRGPPDGAAMSSFATAPRSGRSLSS
jgi:hypothetical protein